MMRTGIAVSVLVVGGLFGAPDPARADVFDRIFGRDHHGDRHRDRDRYGYADAYSIGFNKGMKDGLHHGTEDGEDGKDFSFAHDRKYRKGDSGYKRSYGPRHEYVAGYRQGYEEGYRQTYGSYRDGRLYRNGRVYRDRDGRVYRGDGRYERSGYRHRHPGREGWCYERHDGEWDDDGGRIIYEEPYRRY